MFEFPHVLVPESIMLTGRGARRAGPVEQAPAKAPIFLPERSQSKVHLSSLPSESMLCACPVLVDPGRLSITLILSR